MKKFFKRSTLIVGAVLAVVMFAISPTYFASAVQSAPANEALTDSKSTFPMGVAASWLQPQEFYIYAKTGEKIDFDYTYSDNANLKQAKINIFAPNGQNLFSYDGSTEADVTRTDVSWSGTASQTGIFIIRFALIDPLRLAGGIGSWNIKVSNASGMEIHGRLWTQCANFNQPAVTIDNKGTTSDNTDDTIVLTDSRLKNITFFAVSDSGYQYKLELKNYNGAGSNVFADSFGLVDENGLSLNKSVNAIIDNAVNGLTAKLKPNTARYRLFYEEPANDLPATAPSADGILNVVPKLLTGNLGGIKSFTPDPAKNYHAGSFATQLSPDFSGTATLEIDANNNGKFDDAVDREIEFMVPGSDANSQIKIPFDGLDGNGIEIPLTSTLNAQIVSNKISPFYMVLNDVEYLPGGVTLTKLNGPDAGNTTIYFDNRDIPADQCWLANPDANGNSTAGTCIFSVPTVFDARSGLDSAKNPTALSWAAGPRNFASGNVWGDVRAIEFWTQNAFDFTSTTFKIDGEPVCATNSKILATDPTCPTPKPTILPVAAPLPPKTAIIATGSIFAVLVVGFATFILSRKLTAKKVDAKRK